MKYLLSLFLMGCSTAPMVVPDTTKPSVAAKILENSVAQSSSSYLWILWYAPILIIVLAWTWSYFIKERK